MNDSLKVMKEFLIAWKEKNWNGMFDLVQLTWKSKEENTVEALSYFFLGRRLKSWKFDKELIPYGFKKEVVKDFQISITFEDLNGKKRKGKIYPRLICEVAPYRASTNGTWGVNPLGISNNLWQIQFAANKKRRQIERGG